MGRPDRFKLMEAKREDITTALSSSERNVLTYTELSIILNRYRSSWELPKATTINDFIKFLTEKEILIGLIFNFPYKPIRRYTWPNVPLYEILCSLFNGAYLSHHTAALYHNLTVNTPQNFFINKEQSNKEWSESKASLIQENVDKAFARKMRQSNNFALYNDRKITLLNGKQTGDLQVYEENDIRVTSIERTLIDIVVRPDYAGGPTEILKIYKKARPLVSIQVLVSTLKKLDYKYPYHQSIGFLLEKAQYPEEDIVLLNSFPKEVDFHLGYNKKSASYSKKWRLFYPKELR